MAGIGAATSGRAREEALRNINEIVRMIIQDFVEERKPIPEGPGNDVEVTAVSQDTPR